MKYQNLILNFARLIFVASPYKRRSPRKNTLRRPISAQIRQTASVMPQHDTISTEESETAREAGSTSEDVIVDKDRTLEQGTTSDVQLTEDLTEEMEKENIMDVETDPEEEESYR